MLKTAARVITSHFEIPSGLVMPLGRFAVLRT